MEERLVRLLDEMIRLGLAEQERDDVQLTLLGRACGESSLSFRSAMRFVELARQVGVGNMTAEQLMAIVQALPEADAAYTPMFKRGTRENIRSQEAANRFGHAVVQALQRYADDQMGYLARCKRAAILKDWIDGAPVDQIEAGYTVTPYQGKIGYGDIRRFADNTRFHLRAAHQITIALFVAGGPTDEAIEQVLRRLEIGVPADGLELVKTVPDLARGDYLALLRAGIQTTAALAAMTIEQATQVLGGPIAPLLAAKLRPVAAQ